MFQTTVAWIKKSITERNLGNYKYVKINILLNNQWVKEEITKKSRKYFEMNENEDTTYQNVWDALKENLKGNL